LSLKWQEEEQDKQEVLHTLSVCVCISYPVCGAHVPYCHL